MWLSLSRSLLFGFEMVVKIRIKVFHQCEENIVYTGTDSLQSTFGLSKFSKKFNIGGEFFLGLLFTKVK
jgi:hypothetical protein